MKLKELKKYFLKRVRFSKYLHGFRYAGYPVRRKVVLFSTQPGPFTGIVVGIVKRYTGRYLVGYTDSIPDFDGWVQASLIERKCFYFYKVFTDWNREFLVPVDEVEFLDEASKQL